jgi:hypothetical protein
MNRHDGPEDGALADRCLTGGLPEFGAPTGSFRRIVQTPGGVSIFYDVGQGQGWQRNIVMNGSPHLPSSIRQCLVGIRTKHRHRLRDELIERHRLLCLATVHQVGAYPRRRHFEDADAGVLQEKALGHGVGMQRGLGRRINRGGRQRHEAKN